MFVDPHDWLQLPFQLLSEGFTDPCLAIGFQSSRVPGLSSCHVPPRLELTRLGWYRVCSIAKRPDSHH
jgi:hypothetical protein